jgi:ABC-type uncharacterized transport system permease subunit
MQCKNWPNYTRSIQDLRPDFQRAICNPKRLCDTLAKTLNHYLNTMTLLVANLAALAIYIFASIFLWRAIKQQSTVSKTQLWSIGSLALVVHGFGIFSGSFTNSGFQLSLFNASSLIFWVINAIVLISSLKKPVHNLFILLFPLSCLSLVAAIIGIYLGEQLMLDYHIASHVILSILAYSLLTIASLQAVFLAYQNKLLKNKQHFSQTRLMPPLQTMEALLFEFVWIGEILLTLAIISGFWFLEDMFAQHLIHKTVFGIAAWVIYAGLLWGRHFQGWRGNTAIRWTLAGFVSLMLAYFGSKLVLEIILNRVG